MFLTLSLSKWYISQGKIPHVTLLHSLWYMVHNFNPYHSHYTFQFMEMIIKWGWEDYGCSLIVECSPIMCEDPYLTPSYEKQ